MIQSLRITSRQRIRLTPPRQVNGIWKLSRYGGGGTPTLRDEYLLKSSVKYLKEDREEKKDI